MSERVDLTGEKIAAALGELASDHGDPSSGSAGRILGMPPDAILARLIEQEKEAARRRLDELDDSLACLSMLSSNLMLLESAGAAERIGLLRGAPAVTAALHSAMTRARRELVGMATGAHPVGMLDGLLLKGAALDPGVAVRLLCPGAVSRSRLGQAHLRALRDAGVAVRIAVTLPAFRVVAVDGLLAYVFPSSLQREPSALEIRGSDFVEVFTELFEYCWVHCATGQQVATGRESGEWQVGPRERSLVRMLADGAKDDAIARSLGVSSRTVRRLISELMQNLGAGSRFQAGVRAMALGWLDE